VTNRVPLFLHIVLVAVATITMPAASEAATVPTGFSDALLAGGLTAPTAMAIAPDGRVFVCEQRGTLRVIKNGVLLSTPFLSLNVDSGGERGLLGIAFDPGFASNHFVYVYYTTNTGTHHNRVSRFTANGDVVVAGSELVLLNLPGLNASNHNGGALHFGPDGMLYIAVGDNDNSSNAQSMSTTFGKLLRINKDGSIPSSNPFFSSTSGNNRAIWARGLRNPYTFAFDPGSSLMFINDVGESTWEEINDGIAGANYGWPTTEGPTSNPSFRSPRYAYMHSGGTLEGCAITGGTFYNPPAKPFPAAYHGDYFFADYCSGWIARLEPASGNSVSIFATGGSAIVDLRVDDAGVLYYLDRGNGGPGAGGVYTITYENSAPGIVTQPASTTVPVGATATFTVAASGTGPFTYQWQRNSASIAGATASSYTTPPVQQSDDGAAFRVIVSNQSGSITSSAAILTVTAGSSGAPTATITQPAAGTLYTGGMTVNIAGTATDPEDGTLPASAFTWRVDFHHDTHLHPFLSGSGARTASFVVPTTGEVSANVWYRIHLTVRDSSGQTNATFVDLQPRKSMITLATSPAGMQLTLDGQPTGATTVQGVVGIERTIGAATQTVGGVVYEFVSWSDGGAATHNINTQATATTYTATFRQVEQPGCTVPGAPVNLVATVNGTSFTLRWNPPASGPPPPTSYRVEYGTASGQTLMAGSVSGSTTSVSGSLPAGQSFFRVRAVNSCGTGPASNEVTTQR
jgi:glucose/arabinose dehydrogenase